jgi:hypothetical protein
MSDDLLIRSLPEGTSGACFCTNIRGLILKRWRVHAVCLSLKREDHEGVAPIQAERGGRGSDLKILLSLTGNREIVF